MIPAMFSDSARRSPRPSECINTVALTCCTYWWHLVLTWLTEQCTGEDAPAGEVQTHLFLSWSRNIYFTFIFLGSHGFKFHGLRSHMAKVEQTFKALLCFQNYTPNGLRLLPFAKSLICCFWGKNDMKMTIKNQDKLVTLWNLSLLRGCM